MSNAVEIVDKDTLNQSNMIATNQGIFHQMTAIQLSLLNGTIDVEEYNVLQWNLINDFMERIGDGR